MPITIWCRQCGKSLNVPDGLAGKRGKCPCGNVVAIPANGDIQPTPSPQMPAPVMGGSSSTGGYKGGVTTPETFKKLFQGILLSLSVAVVCLILALVAGIIFIGSAVQGAQGFDAEMKYQQAVQQWEFRGKRGPKPARPPATRSSSGGGMIVGILVPVMYLIGFLSYIGMIAFLCLFLYKAWDLIQDGNVRTSPGKAVGFMFIPFFNLYWQFVAWMGLCEDLNKYSQERGITAQPTAPGMMMAALILNLVGCGMVGVILMFICLNQIKNACMDIAEAKMAA